MEAVVDLSGERDLGELLPGVDFNSYAAAPGLRSPALFAVACDDRYVSVGDIRAVLHRARSRVKGLVVIDLVGVARHVAAPTPVISAREDPYVDGATRPLFAALGVHDKRALILSGADHGTALLTDGACRRVRATILPFVAAAH